MPEIGRHKPRRKHWTEGELDIAGAKIKELRKELEIANALIRTQDELIKELTK